MNLVRGMRYALFWSAVGLATPIFLGIGFTVVRWVLQGADAFDRAYDLHWLPKYLVFPVLGTGFLFGAAGWATYAPDSKHKFVSTLVMLSAISVPSWIILSVSGATPPRYKSIEHPLVYPSEVLLFGIPPIMSAIVLSFHRRADSTVIDGDHRD